jgi:hypothetical protein
VRRSSRHADLLLTKGFEVISTAMPSTTSSRIGHRLASGS